MTKGLRVLPPAVCCIALVIAVLGCAANRESTFKIVKEGADKRVAPLPLQVTDSTQPFAQDIPLTIAADDHATELVVLKPGAEVVASTPNGTVRIKYLAPDRRLIEWTDDLNEGTGRTYSQEVQLYPHPSRIWYSVSGKYTRDPFPEGDKRIMYHEGQLRAKSLEEAAMPLRISPSMCYVAGREGLVVGYWPTNTRNDVQLSLTQVYVMDKKAEGLSLGKGSVELVEK
jgi:hypothetical protein